MTGSLISSSPTVRMALYFVEGPQILYHNGGNGNTWLKIKLVGTMSNRQGLGAKVTIQIGQTTQYREMNGA